MATDPPDKESDRDTASLAAGIEALNRDKMLARERRLKTEAEFDDVLRKARETLAANSADPPPAAPLGETPGSARLREEMQAWTALTVPAAAPPAIAAPSSSTGPGVDVVVPAPAVGTPDPALPTERAGSDAAHDAVPAPEATAAGAVRAGGNGRTVAALAGVLLTALALWLVVGRRSEQVPPSTATRIAPSDTPPVGHSGSPPAAAAPAPPPANAPATSALSLEVTTLRGVWLRVVVDGERMIERELPAGETRRFEGTTTIAVRTGDAGALRIRLNGRDLEPLGKDGEVVSRTFTVDAVGPTR